MQLYERIRADLIMEEIYIDVVGFEGIYQISNYGNVKSLERFRKTRKNSGYIQKERILKYSLDKDGYKYVVLLKNNIRKTIKIHRLVAIHFIKNPDNKDQVNHIDGNKGNNLLFNLEWVTHSENQLHSYNVLKNKPNNPSLGKFGKENKLSKKITQFDLCGNEIKIWDSISDAYRATGISVANISACAKFHKNYRHAGGFIWRFYNGED